MDAAVAELADALDSGSSPGHRVGVQVPSAAPDKEKMSREGSFFSRFYFCLV